MCLIEAESGGDSGKVTEFPNLSSSYGVFQINSKEWCRKGRRGGECGIRCEGNRPHELVNSLVTSNLIERRYIFRIFERRHKRRHKVRKSDLQPARIQILEGLAEPLQVSPIAWRFKMFVLLKTYSTLLTSPNSMAACLELSWLKHQHWIVMIAASHSWKQESRYKTHLSLSFICHNSLDNRLTIAESNMKVLANGKRNKPTHASCLPANRFLFFLFVSSTTNFDLACFIQYFFAKLMNVNNFFISRFIGDYTFAK